MGDKTGIEWTDATWNPVVGCSKVSPGCAHCYAEEVHRTRLDGRAGYATFKPWTPENAEHNVRMLPERLDQPLRWTKPRMIFVNSMSDLFHELVDEMFILRVMDVVRRCPQHTFQVLTKRPERARDLLRRWWLQIDGGENIAPANLWLGTSIENRRFVGRADALRDTPAAVRFISAEPLLGPLVHDARVVAEAHVRGVKVGPVEIDTQGRMIADGRAEIEVSRLVTDWADGYDGPALNLDRIDWLIVGGESGSHHRPMRPEWARALRDEAQRHGVAFLFKQWGGRTPKAGGRTLDGQTHDEYPRRELTLEHL